MVEGDPPAATPTAASAPGPSAAPPPRPTLDLESIADGLFFIVGPPRSGTTLVQAVLSAHPTVHVPPETEYFRAHEPPTEARTDDAAWTAWLDRTLASEAWRDQGLDDAAFRARLADGDRSPRTVFLEWMRLAAESAGRSRVGEKSPDHALDVARIADLFPRARFIVVLRDPRDVVASRLATPWSQESHVTVARKWNAVVDHLETARRELSERMYFLRFESVVTELETIARELCAFLDLPYDDAMLRFWEREHTGFAAREAAWKSATRSPLDPKAIGRYRTRLTPRQIAGVQRTIGRRLTTMGYAPDALPFRPDWFLRDRLDRLGEHLRRHGRSVRKRLGGRRDA